MSALVSSISSLSHEVWRANQMGSHQAAVIPTGYRALDEELPDGGWPSAALIELLLPQAGIGEMRLLRPALGAIAGKRPIALVQPPLLPQVAAWAAWGLPAKQLLWIKTKRSKDALWAAEQVLRNGSCGALLLWQSQIRTESLRRLHLAAQGAQTLFWMLRPIADAQNPSPATLRLALRPAGGGIDIGIIKRRGPQRDDMLFVPLDGLPASSSTSFPLSHAHLDRYPSALPAARSLPAALV